MTTILFLHGWQSIPGGVKPTYLKDHGFEVINPALDDDDFEVAVATAQAEFDKHQPQVVVGSSRGGAVAMNINISNANFAYANFDIPVLKSQVAMNINTCNTKLVLLCPAWKKWGVAKTVRPGTVILHSRSDDVVPFSDSEELVASSGLPPETLIEIGNDHRLADGSSLSVLLWVCKLFASGQEFPGLEGEKPSFVDASSQDEGSYVCDACGEEIIIPLDLTEGSSQTYVEDCPVCCRANTIHVQVDDEGNAQVRAEPEQDYE